MQKSSKTTWILILYLLGLFMGALDTGIVTPARSVIQSQLGVSDSIGIWMITIFTLAYAASIPITGKLADRYGSKLMYMVSIFLFGLGSLICVAAAYTDSFAILLTGRVIQALGGGGIMPLVTAEIGTSFPPEKRGMALGIVGGVYGIANILGSSAGSAILGVAGNEGWSWLFLINVPISIFIVFAGIFTLENRKIGVSKKMDLQGTVVLTAMILSLMYGLTNIEFFDFINSIQSVTVYPYLISFVVLLPFLYFIERKAEDPILNLKYFSDKNMIITFATGILVGVAMMGMIFVPQFAENALRIKTGTGGYFVTLLGVFAGIGAPLSGKFVDKYGAKSVLMGGFLFNLAGGLFLAFVATRYMNLFTVFVALFFMGLGMGFTMGTPLNYMVLSSVPKQESNAALATLSLIRSIGTVISPAIMVGFLAASGTQLQTDLMKQLPEPPQQLVLQEAEALKPLLEQIKNDPELMKRMDPAMLDIDRQMSQSSTSFDMSPSENGDAAIPQSLIDDFKAADVTSIAEVVVRFADQMFTENVTPELIREVQAGIQEGIDGIGIGLTEMNKASVSLMDEKAELSVKQQALEKDIAAMDQARSGIKKALLGTSQGLNGLEKALFGVNQGIKGLEQAISGTTLGLEGMKKGLSEQEAALARATDPGSKIGLSAAVQATNAKITETSDALTALKAKQTATLAQAASLTKQIDSVKQQQLALEKKYADLSSAQSGMREGVKGLAEAQAGMLEGLTAIADRKALLEETSVKMIALKEAIPGAFAASKSTYLGTLKRMSPELQATFQKGLNIGFTQMYLFVALLSALGILVLAFYKTPDRPQQSESLQETVTVES